jgi:hypothetical protein
MVGAAGQIGLKGEPDVGLASRLSVFQPNNGKSSASSPLSFAMRRPSIPKKAHRNFPRFGRTPPDTGGEGGQSRALGQHHRCRLNPSQTRRRPLWGQHSSASSAPARFAALMPGRPAPRRARRPGRTRRLRRSDIGGFGPRPQPPRATRGTRFGGTRYWLDTNAYGPPAIATPDISTVWTRLRPSRFAM